MTAAVAQGVGRWRYLGSYLGDQFGDGLLYTSLGWISTPLAGPLGSIGIVGAAAVARLLGTFLLGGAVADRFGARSVVTTTLLIRVLALAAFGIAATAESVSAVFVTALAFGAVDGVHGPAMEALSIDAAPGDQESVQGLMVSSKEIALLASGPIAGVLIGWHVSLVAGLGILALTLSRALLTGTIRGDESVAAPPVALIQEGLGAWRKVIRLPGIARLLVPFMLANLFASPILITALPIIAHDRSWHAWQFGSVDAGVALGALVGGIAVTYWSDQLKPAGPRWALLSLIPMSAALASIGVVSSWVWCCVLGAVAGVSMGMGPALLKARMNDLAPKEFIGRVVGVRLGSIMIGTPVGYALLAGLQPLMGTPAAIVTLGAALLVVSAFLVRSVWTE